MQNKEAIEFLQKELDDAYKRKEKIGLKYSTKYIVTLEMAIKALKQQPSITPSRHKGHWIYKTHRANYIPSDAIIVCNKCHHIRSRVRGDILNFCPNCGTDMRGNTDAE